MRRSFPVLIATLLLGFQPGAEPNTAPRTLVVVAAHPDDETPIGPVLARYGREGARVHLIIATDGAQGSTHTSIPPGAELARARAGEALCATEALGISSPIFLGFPDGELGSYLQDRDRLPRLTARLSAELERLRPDALITWGPDGGTGHPDHRLVSSIVTELVRAGARGVPERLFYASIPAEGVRQVNPARAAATSFLAPQAKYLSTRVSFTPADFEAARRAMACHRTQFSGDVVERLAEAMRVGLKGELALAPLFPAGASTDLFER